MAYLESLHGKHSDASAKSPMRRELEHIGLSESVIDTAERGLYTSEQLEKLKFSKLELNRIVADALYAVRVKNMAAKGSVEAQSGPPNTDGTLHSVSEAQEEVGHTQLGSPGHHRPCRIALEEVARCMN